MDWQLTTVDAWRRSVPETNNLWVERPNSHVSIVLLVLLPQSELLVSRDRMHGASGKSKCKSNCISGEGNENVCVYTIVGDGRRSISVGNRQPADAD